MGGRDRPDIVGLHNDIIATLHHLVGGATGNAGLCGLGVSQLAGLVDLVAAVVKVNGGGDVVVSNIPFPLSAVPLDFAPHPSGVVHLAAAMRLSAMACSGIVPVGVDMETLVDQILVMLCVAGAALHWWGIWDLLCGIAAGG